MQKNDTDVIYVSIGALPSWPLSYPHPTVLHTHTYTLTHTHTRCLSHRMVNRGCEFSDSKMHHPAILARIAAGRADRQMGRQTRQLRHQKCPLSFRSLSVLQRPKQSQVCLLEYFFLARLPLSMGNAVAIWLPNMQEKPCLISKQSGLSYLQCCG